MVQRTLNSYLKNKYGRKIYKVSINAGFTCPNRDGTLGNRGCIFCSAGGSGDFAEDSALSVTEQIEQGKKRIAAKLPDKDYGLIAYFQAFTNTYAPIEKLERVYMEAASHPEVEIISIATRPDCLGEEVLDLLRRVNETKPVWVELGLQTIHEKTAEYIRRGYPLSAYDEAVRNLKAYGMETIVHVILGLPGETKEEMLETVKYVGESGVEGIKLQLLHVLENTDLADDYRAGKFECLSLDEYASLVKDALDVLPNDIVIHRMTGDGDKKILIAPKWSEDKKNVLNTLHRVCDIREK
ncbi:MAG: TIGR01212 family radical SAM protein [Lachnospiraceae bacterium]|nr:TIGR01212 family radical SAM protein [Lachnospiraceae bacterium]